jgi:hypothetical protein
LENPTLALYPAGQMMGRQTCVGCGRVSPETNGENTLTTSFGWRVRRGTDEAGNSAVEWRCAACWQRWKAQQAGSGSDAPASSGNSPSSAPSRAPRGGNR